MEKHPREAHAPATRSTPAWRTDSIDTILDGRERQLSSIEFPSIGRVDDVGKGRFEVGKGRFDVGSGGSGHVKSRVQEIETHELKKNGSFTFADRGAKMREIQKTGIFILADHGNEMKKTGTFKSADHDHETSLIKKSGSSKVADLRSSMACGDISGASRHIGEAKQNKKARKAIASSPSCSI